jgi:hypothetical protein
MGGCSVKSGEKIHGQGWKILSEFLLDLNKSVSNSDKQTRKSQK